MDKMITIFLPVYKEPKFAGDIVGKFLQNDYKAKEIIVIVDGETNDEIEAALSPVKDKIKLIYNGERLGKTESLKKAINQSHKDSSVYLFFDNDIIVPEKKDFLSVLMATMERFDLAEIPKEGIAKSFLSRIMSYEFMTFAMATYVISKITRRCPSMNGAAFACTRELFEKLGGFRKVVNEDMDFAARAFKVHARFSYNRRLKVMIDVHEDFKTWFDQRKRWALDNVLWIKQHFDIIMPGVFRYPLVILAGLTLFLPLIAYLVAYYLFNRVKAGWVMPTFLMIISHYHIAGGLLLWFAHAHLISKGILPVVIGLAVSLVIYFVFTRFFKSKFYFFAFIIYYFIYSPVCSLVNVIMAFLLLFRVKVKFDWKV